MAELLNVQGLETQFVAPDSAVHVLNGVSFTLNEGEVLGIVGESGSGKSVLMLSMLRLIPQPPAKIVKGKVYFKGKDLFALSDDELLKFRLKNIGIVHQELNTVLNPANSVGKQLSDPLIQHFGLKKEEARERVVSLFQQVGLPDANTRFDDSPQQLSSGMRQRVMIANALIGDPSLFISDQSTTALDPIVQAQILEMLKKRHDRTGMSVIWITNDLGVTAGFVNRVIVMYAGYFVEEGDVKSLYANPQHPYTLGLMGSLPRFNDDRRQRLNSIQGIPPVLKEIPGFCPFLSRCRYAIERCKSENPTLTEVGSNHRVACWVDPQTGKARS
jgi:oligopeptide transport system ATP-binding protein